MSARERMKRYRKRIRDGVFVVPVEVDHRTLDGLVAAGLLPGNWAGDATEVAAALQDAVTRLPRSGKLRL